MISLPLIGGLLGLGIAIVTYFLFGIAIEKMRHEPERETTVRILDYVRLSEFVVMPATFYFAFSMIE